MKKIVLLFMTFLLVSAAFGKSVVVDGIMFTLNTRDSTATVVKSEPCSDTKMVYEGNIEIPASFVCEGTTYRVTRIGHSAFKNCTNLVSVSIPLSVTRIDGYAFENCTKLASVSISDSVTQISGKAFAGCQSINKPLYNSRIFVYLPRSFKGEYCVPEGIEIIADEAFDGCDKLKSVVLPSTLKEIGTSAFSYCRSLKSVQLPSSLQYISAYAFGLCESLVSLVIPENVEEVGDYAFHGCAQLKEIVYLGNNTKVGRGLYSTTATELVVTKDGQTFTPHQLVVTRE